MEEVTAPPHLEDEWSRLNEAEKKDVLRWAITTFGPDLAKDVATAATNTAIERCGDMLNGLVDIGLASPEVKSAWAEALAEMKEWGRDK